MKFVHMADMHFDTPFTQLNKNNLGAQRRLEQREAFQTIINYIKQNQIEYFFICGDLYEHEYVKQSTIEYINNKAKEIPNTKIYIIPGNHDPKMKNSYYNTFCWNDNIYIFGNKIEKKTEKEVDIYGFGFDQFYLKDTQINQINIENPNKINILLTHGAIEGGYQEDKQYNPMKEQMLKQLGFDYIALGHIHKPYYKEQPNQNIIYPGSTISLGFDEQGQHGIIVGTIEENKKLQINFLPIDTKEFEETILPVDDFLSKEELIEAINQTIWDSYKYYKIILTGNRTFEIEPSEIIKYITIPNIIKIKNQTTIAIDLEKLAKEDSLKGIFVRNLLQQKTPENEEKILRAIEIGLQAM
ncbi:MAG: DNA repair exonuclease [Clostridia bacterium]|nr:DNA repair exonuclease [Clostridia bacterium]